jgi:hypothetical protein
VVSSLTVSSLTGGNQFFSTLSGSEINASSIVVSSMVSNTIQFSTMNGSTATIPLIFVSTLQLDSYSGSTITTSTLIAVNTYASSIITSSISVNTYYLNQAVYGQTMKKDSIDVFTNVTLQASDIVGFVDNPPSTLQVYTIGSTIQNQWIAGGAGVTNLATGSNGITWPTTSTIGVLSQINGIVWTGNLWVATGYGINDTIATSVNGLDWTGRGRTLQTSGSSPTATLINGICILCSAILLFVTGAGAAIGYSNDNGTTWYNITVSSGLTSANGIAFNGRRAVVVGAGATNSIAWSDQFSVSWTPVINSNTIFTDGINVIWTGHQWVAGGLGPNRIAYSLDGITWTGSTSGNGVFNTIDSSGNPISKVYGLGWNGTMMIAVADDAINTIAYSIDEGITWVGLGKTIFTTYGYSVTWNGQMWVATGKGTNTIAYSYNGKNWNGSGTSAINDTGFCVAFNSRRPYTLTISTMQTSTCIGTVPNASLPIVVPANSQLDIVSDSYYNSGYTNFSIALQTHAS